MNRLDYISLFTKTVIGSISAKEADQLTEMSNDPNSKAEIKILQKIWDASANYSPEPSFSVSEAFQKFKKDQIVQSVDSTKIKSKFYKTFILGALAVVAIVASLLFFFNNHPKTFNYRYNGFHWSRIPVSTS